MTSIPHLLHVFPGFGIGGAEVRTATLLNEFGAHYRHSILSLNGGLECMSRLSPDLDVSVVEPPDLAAPFRAVSGPAASRSAAWMRYSRHRVI
jgi:hypothetical protein